MADSSKLDPIPNVLHYYSTYTYGISLIALTTDDYNNLLTGTYQTKNVLISSGGRHSTDFQRHPLWQQDFYFNRLIMNTAIGINARGKGSNVVSLEFDIIEPYGITLLDRLVKTAQDIGVENYMQIPYLLDINFFGYNDQNLSPVSIPQTHRRIPIKILKIDIGFNQAGSTYHINAVPFNHMAFLDTVSTVPIVTKLRGEKNDKGILLSSLLSTNDAQARLLTQTQTERAESIRAEEQRQKDNAAKEASWLVGGAGGIFNTSSIKASAEQQIHNVELGPAGLGTLLNTYYAYLAKIDYGTDAVPPYKFNFFLVDNGDSKGKLGDAIVYEQELIPLKNRFMSRIADQGHIQNAMQTANPQAPQKNLEGIDVIFQAGISIQEILSQLLKCTDYLRSQVELEKNTENTKPEDPLMFFKITPRLTLGPYIPAKDDYQYNIDIAIVPYKSFGNRLPFAPSAKPSLSDCVKQYDYLFTGKNNDITDLKIEFNTAYYTQYTFNPDRFKKEKDQINDKTSETKITSIKTDGESKKFRAVKYAVPNTPADYQHAEVDEKASRVNDLANNLYASSKADMLSIEMSILGDPSFIQEQEFSYTWNKNIISNDDPRLTKSGSLLVNNGELLVKLDFKMPEDIDTEKGLYDLKGKSRLGDSMYNGIYKILTIDSIFENGIFTQRLKLIRVFNDYYSQQEPNSAKTTRPGS